MALIIDVAIVAIILLFTFLGYKRGLVKLALHLCTFFIAVILAFILFRPISNLIIEKTPLDNNIENAIVNKISPEYSDSKFVQNLPEFLIENGSNTVQDVAHSFTMIIIETGCFLAIFILVKILLKFVTFLADLIAKLPILNSFNSLGGTIYGILEGVLIVFVLFAIVSVISPLIDNSILNTINESTLGSWIYNNNIIMKFFI